MNASCSARVCDAVTDSLFCAVIPDINAAGCCIYNHYINQGVYFFNLGDINRLILILKNNCWLLFNKYKYEC